MRQKIDVSSSFSYSPSFDDADTGGNESLCDLMHD
jgi:hypothetical protein